MKTQISRQLPNSVREALFKLKRTDVVRTLEGLRHKGIQPGQTITAEDATTLLRGIVGRDSIYHAFTAQTPDGQSIFGTISPSAHPIAPIGAAKNTNKNYPINALLVEPKNQEKSNQVAKNGWSLCPPTSNCARNWA